MCGFACEEEVDAQKEAVFKHLTSKVVLKSSQSTILLKL